MHLVAERIAIRVNKKESTCIFTTWPISVCATNHWDLTAGEQLIYEFISPRSRLCSRFQSAERTEEKFQSPLSLCVCACVCVWVCLSEWVSFKTLPPSLWSLLVQCTQVRQPVFISLTLGWQSWPDNCSCSQRPVQSCRLVQHLKSHQSHPDFIMQSFIARISGAHAHIWKRNTSCI